MAKRRDDEDKTQQASWQRWSDERRRLEGSDDCRSGDAGSVGPSSVSQDGFTSSIGEVLTRSPGQGRGSRDRKEGDQAFGR